MSEVFQSIKDFFTNIDELIYIGQKILVVILILISIKILLHFGSIIIDKFFQRQKKSRFGFDSRKADTLGELLKSILRYTLYIIGILTILDQVGYDTSTLLVGAGLGGVALGFGAQSIVKDIITGFFILFEDQFSVGEYVTIDDMSGIVEVVGLRTTRVKGFTGDLYIIPNGQIGKVVNHSRDNIRALVDVEVSYDADINRTIEVLNTVSKEFKSSCEDIVEGPTVLGVSNLGESGVTIRVIARTKPMSQWNVEMDLRKRIKEAFDRESINIPYPTRVIITKNGNN